MQRQVDSSRTSQPRFFRRPAFRLSVKLLVVAGAAVGCQAPRVTFSPGWKSPQVSVKNLGRSENLVGRLEKDGKWTFDLSDKHLELARKNSLTLVVRTSGYFDEEWRGLSEAWLTREVPFQAEKLVPTTQEVAINFDAVKSDGGADMGALILSDTRRLMSGPTGDVTPLEADARLISGGRLRGLSSSTAPLRLAAESSTSQRPGNWRLVEKDLFLDEPSRFLPAKVDDHVAREITAAAVSGQGRLPDQPVRVSVVLEENRFLTLARHRPVLIEDEKARLSYELQSELQVAFFDAADQDSCRLPEVPAVPQMLGGFRALTSYVFREHPEAEQIYERQSRSGQAVAERNAGTYSRVLSSTLNPLEEINSYSVAAEGAGILVLAVTKLRENEMVSRLMWCDNQRSTRDSNEKWNAPWSSLQAFPTIVPDRQNGSWLVYQTSLNRTVPVSLQAAEIAINRDATRLELKSRDINLSGYETASHMISDEKGRWFSFVYDRRNPAPRIAQLDRSPDSEAEIRSGHLAGARQFCYNTETGRFFHDGWAADNRNRRTLYTLKGNRTASVLARSPVATHLGKLDCSEPAISPDGRYLLFTAKIPYGPQITEGLAAAGRRAHLNEEIFVARLNAEGEAEKAWQITANPSADYLPAWCSEQPNKIYFLSNRGGVVNVWSAEINFDALR